MKPNERALEVTIVGGGMITHDLLLPSIYHLQRMGVVNQISVCALNSSPLRVLKENRDFHEAFPGQDFTPYPPISEPPDRNFPALYKDAIAAMPARNVVVVAVPDHLHYEVIVEALRHHQHVLCVKPLLHKYEQSVEIEKLAATRGLFVGIEYHKRFDRRSLVAKRSYTLKHFGQFIMGEAKLIEPYYYRFSNFQNWFTPEWADPFTYIGCHYVDLVYFITGLKPVEVSVVGIRGKFPNGNEGYLWSHARVAFENGALLSVINGLGYPDAGPGANDQCLVMYCEGEGKNALIEHDDQYRGMAHCYVQGLGPGGSEYNYVGDFYRLVPWEGAGYRPVGYGFDSVAAIVNTIHRMESEVVGLPPEAALNRRRAIIQEADAKGIIATPANSFINVLVVEAARISIQSGGAPVKIVYGEQPHVEAK